MPDTLVSVVIPTYNYAHYVTAAVQSALAQTYANTEVIVVDDGSTDDTHTRLTPYLERIRYIYQENQGLSAARNTGIRVARGELIALLDSDDLWHPRKLEAQVPHMLAAAQVGLVGAQDWPQTPRSWPQIKLPTEARPVTIQQLLIRARFGPSSVLIRKACLPQVGMFDTSLRSVEDRDMWLRLAARYHVLRVEAPLYWYRLHGGNMSTNTPRMEAHELRVLHRAFDELAPLRERSLRRWRLKRVSLSWVRLRAAYGYDLGGQRLRALGRLLWSMWLWPLPLARQDVEAPLMRVRKLAVLLMRALHLAKPDHLPIVPDPTANADVPELLSPS